MRCRSWCRLVNVEAGLTQIRVHELASELDVSTQQVRTILEDLGQKVRGPSTVIGISVAARVRGRLRLPKAPSAVGSAAPEDSTSPKPALATSSEHTNQEGLESLGSSISLAVTVTAQTAAPVATPPLSAADVQTSLFLPPVAPIATVTVARSTGAFVNPFTVPTVRHSRTSPPASLAATPRALQNRVPSIPPPLVIDVEPDFDTLWEARGISKSDQAKWLAGGLRPSEAELADRCQAAGISADELAGKLSGRTALQRLRDGEASTSVWARIRESEQQPRRAGTRLTGRFQLS